MPFRGRTDHEGYPRCFQKTKADIIIMGTHGVSASRNFPGQQCLPCNPGSKVPGAFCPAVHTNPGFKNILMPFRDRPHSREKVDYAIDLAKTYNAQLHVLAIDTEFTKAHRKKVALQGSQIQEIAAHRGVKCNLKVIEHVYLMETILKHAEKVQAD
jgi:nucleotide-binding universal stress UspA family protein